MTREVAEVQFSRQTIRLYNKLRRPRRRLRSRREPPKLGGGSLAREVGGPTPGGVRGPPLRLRIGSPSASTALSEGIVGALLRTRDMAEGGVFLRNKGGRFLCTADAPGPNPMPSRALVAWTAAAVASAVAAAPSIIAAAATTTLQYVSTIPPAARPPTARPPTAPPSSAQARIWRLLVLWRRRLKISARQIRSYVCSDGGGSAAAVARVLRARPPSARNTRTAALASRCRCRCTRQHNHARCSAEGSGAAGRGSPR